MFALGNMKLGSERHKRYYDHKAQNHGFEHGDLFGSIILGEGKAGPLSCRGPGRGHT